MLIGEVLETAKETIVDEPLSTFAVGLAVQALLVLRDPLHCMYEKINNSLNKSPKWNTEKLPSYWIDAVFVHPPTNDDCHYREIDWILDVLVDSLRSLGVGSPSSRF
jgi:nucleolar pre-ribosomal-associated protein 1